jgi:hypothetical protein
MRLPGNQIVEETFDLRVKTIADLAVFSESVIDISVDVTSSSFRMPAALL